MYSNKIRRYLEKNKIKIGDLISLNSKLEVFEGILLDRPDYLKGESLIIKLNNGYNIGINIKNIIKIKLVKKNIVKKEKIEKIPIPKKPFISILHTGGTIASKVDYRTGGVVASFNPQELLSNFPTLKKYGNIHSVFLGNMFSEDMNINHYKKMALAVKKEVELGSKGVIITHGTDTMHYSSSALSFIFENLAIPVIFVGAQRSSDRGSSDAEMNLICAMKFISKTEYRGVAVCMHETHSDDVCNILSGVNVRKLHSSNRNAFKQVNKNIIAKVEYQDDDITFFSRYNKTTDKIGEFKVKPNMESKVAIVKIHPNISSEIFAFFREKKYKGLIIEGTGLGHAPINVVDEFTNSNKKIKKEIEKLVKSGCVVVMTTQTIHGRVNMNVYSTGRDLQNIGVISGETMISETAFTKLSWLLKNEKKNCKKIMLENLKGEIIKRLLL